jgi:flagellar protein FlaJ
VENLKKWTDAYAAILVSVTLIMVVSLVSTMMGNLGEKFIVLMGLVLFSITTIGVYIIFKVAPAESTTYTAADGMPFPRRMARISLMAAAPVGLASGMLLATRFDFLTGSAVFFVCVGVSLIPAAVFAWLDDARLTRLDEMVPMFIRSVGNVAGAADVNIIGALARIDTRSMGALEPQIINLRMRLEANLPSDQCWEAFRKETGSDLVNRGSHMLIDGTTFGGRADVVGEISSRFAQSVVQLRAKRRLTSATFSFLTLPLHATMVFVLVFVLQIVATFNTELSDAYSATGYDTPETAESIESNLAIPDQLNVPQPEELVGGIGFFAVQDLTLVTYTVVMVVFMLTVANSLAPMFAAGGSGLKIATFLSPMCLLSGLILGAIPIITPVIFSV